MGIPGPPHMSAPSVNLNNDGWGPIISVQPLHLIHGWGPIISK